jgi:hypothetical protein
VSPGRRLVCCNAAAAARLTDAHADEGPNSKKASEISKYREVRFVKHDAERPDVGGGAGRLVVQKHLRRSVNTALNEATIERHSGPASERNEAKRAKPTIES